MTDEELVEHALGLLAANDYATLATVGPDGLPWASPVWAAADGLEHLYWVSSLDSDHSRNLAARPWLSYVVFDSTVRAFHGRALYARATARVLEGEPLAAGLLVYPGVKGRGAVSPDPGSLTGRSPWRLFLAQASEVWVLCPRPPREPCPRHGRDEDHRTRVWPPEGSG